MSEPPKSFLEDRSKPIALTREFEAQRRLPQSFRKRLKGILAYLPSSHYARLIAQWPELRLWKKRYLSDATPEFAGRYDMYNYLIRDVLPDRIAYLEFGCANGEIVDMWALKNPHPDARFWGFDTFTGMPEEWRGLGWTVKKHEWSQDGKIPEYDDPRIGFVKGRFQDSLEDFLNESKVMEADFDQYVIHIDSDLYSAALYVLSMLRPVLHRSIVLFDEFDCVLDEIRALDDFCRAFDYDYTVLGTANSCEKVAIRFNFKDVASKD